MKITMKFYFDCGYEFGESLKLTDSLPRPITVRLDHIAKARQGLLALTSKSCCWKPMVFRGSMSKCKG